MYQPSHNLVKLFTLTHGHMIQNHKWEVFHVNEIGIFIGISLSHAMQSGCDSNYLIIFYLTIHIKACQWCVNCVMYAINWLKWIRKGMIHVLLLVMGAIFIKIWCDIASKSMRRSEISLFFWKKNLSLSNTKSILKLSLVNQALEKFMHIIVGKLWHLLSP